MFFRESLVVKLGTVDTLTTSTITSCEITTLDHELLDNAVEDGVFVVKGLPSLPDALLTSA